MSRSLNFRLFALSAIAMAAHLTAAQAATDTVLGETTVRATAEEELKQALGVSVITQEELRKVCKTRPQCVDLEG